MLVGDIDRHVAGEFWCWSGSWFDRYVVNGSSDMAWSQTSNDFGNCSGNMAVNRKASLAWRFGCRCDDCCISGGHEGGNNECDERGIHNERSLQIHEVIERGSQKGEASEKRQKQSLTSEFAGTNCSNRCLWDG